MKFDLFRKIHIQKFAYWLLIVTLKERFRLTIQAELL